MFPDTIPSRVRAGAFSRLSGVLFLIALTAGCVPVPMKQTVYLPEGADVVSQGGGGWVCGFSAPNTEGARRFENVKVSTSLSANARDPGAGARLTVEIVQFPENGKFLSTSIDPRRIKLQEGGRVLSASVTDDRTNTISRSGGPDLPAPYKLRRIRMSFPAPSGIQDSVTVSFQSGAFSYGGRSLPYEPIRFNRSEDVSIYMFPCIPS